MGTGWRRAFCTAAPRDSTDTDTRDLHHQRRPDKVPGADQNGNPIHSPRSCLKLGLSSCTDPTTPPFPELPATTAPTLSCRITTTTTADSATLQPISSANYATPRLQCKTDIGDKTTMAISSQGLSLKTSNPGFSNSNPASPRSPFSILKNTLRLSSSSSRNGCGVCSQGIKTGQGMAIFTAECSHAFHFSCIVSHLPKQASLVCPVCNLTWKDVPLLSPHRYLPSSSLSPRGQQPAEDSPVLEKATITSVSPAKSTKPYNDDEPLFSPTAGVRFYPIPEETDDDEAEQDPDGDVAEDGEELQSLLVSPGIRKALANEHDHHKPLRNNVEVRFLHEAAIISASRTHEAFAVSLRVKAPTHPPPPAGDHGAPAAPHNRAPIDLVTVLDVGGSMSGTKLQLLKRAMRLVISSLGSADRLSIVAFAATSQRILPLRRMTPHGQRSARRIISRLGCGQGKCVREALMKASKVLEDRRERNPVASIILLSDGGEDQRAQENDGGFGFDQQRLPPSHDSSIRFAHIEIPVRSVSGEPEEEALAKCVGGLLSVVAQDMRVQLRFAAGSATGEITAAYSSHSRPTLLSSDSARIGDVYAGEEREVLIELKMPAPATGAHHVMSVRCSYRDPATQELVHCRERCLLVPHPHAVRSSTDPAIERLWKLFVSTRAAAESRRLAEHGDFTGALQLISSARAVLMKAGHPTGDEFTMRLQAAEAELKWRCENHMKEDVVEAVRRWRMCEKEVAAAAAAAFHDENGEPLTPTSAWRAAERLAKVAVMKKSLNKVRDLHGLENARF